MRHTFHKRLLPVVLLGLLVSASAASSVSSPTVVLPRPQESVSIHLTLGNPSGATTSARNKDNFLMVKPQFALSYNDKKGGANWVSWHLEKSDIGKVNRGDFHVDADLPMDFKHIKKADYNNSGFDRGHLCNSKDRTKNKTNNDATFNMTNILPQRPDNNQGPWKKLEEFSRRLVVNEGGELYIVAGAFGSSGSIAGGQVNVPKTFWKLIFVLPKGDDDLDRINKDTRAIAICMPNKQGIKKKDWREFVTTIRNIEAATGFDFLSELSASVQKAIETHSDAEGTTPAGVNPCQ